MTGIVIQQDIKNTNMFARSNMSDDQRWNTIRRPVAVLLGVYALRNLMDDKSMDNKRCPLRLVFTDRGGNTITISGEEAYSDDLSKYF